MYITSSSVSNVLSAAKSLCTGQNDLFTVFFAETDVPDIEELQRELTGAGIRFMGGISPGLIVGTTLRDCGALICRYSSIFGPFVIQDYITEDIPYDIVQDMDLSSAGGGTTVMIYFPGPGSSSRFLRQMYGMFGNGVTYIGSGMGYDDGISRPCVFSNELFSDSMAVFAVLSANCSVAARHGFIPISKPMISTATDHNCVLEINWKNPWDEYLSAIEGDCRTECPDKNPEHCVTNYPMVLQTDFPESVCRAVLKIAPDGSLFCGGDVPENATFRVAKYSYQSLLDAAASATETATAGLQEKPAVLFLIDCISRKWIAGEKYQCELEAVGQVLSEKSMDIQIEGILSFGEISSMGTGMLECLNFTCVAGLFHMEESGD